jgi:hypothetical protein
MLRVIGAGWMPIFIGMTASIALASSSHFLHIWYEKPTQLDDFRDALRPENHPIS